MAWYTKYLPEAYGGGCKCADAWAKYTASNPPDFKTASGFLDWSIIAHDHVSANHVKPALPVIGLEAGRKLWLGPKVLFISCSYGKVGGTETFHKTLLNNLRMRMNILGFCATGFGGGDARALGVPYSFGADEAKKLAQKADIVVTWGVDSLKYVLEGSKARVLAVHHSDASSWWNNEIVSKQMDAIDSVVCVHPGVAQEIQAKTDKRVVYIPNAVDKRRIATHTKSNVRKKHGLGQSEKILFWCHRLSKEKQPQLAADIGRMLPKGWTLVMAGEGAEPPTNVDGKKVRLIGGIDNPSEWLGEASVFMSNATFEGFGLSIAEAMASGVPVVSTHTGIANSEICDIVDKDAPAEEWLAAVLACNGAKTREAKRVCQELYSQEVFIDNWEAEIRRLAGGR